MPEHEAALSDDEASPSGEDRDQPDDASEQSSSGAVTRSGEQWKAAIQAQKDAIAAMQSQVDKLNASVHFVEANRYTNGVQYNQYQLEKQKQVQQMQKQLDTQKKKLEDMQEAARKAGFGSSVYDP
jgi:predicted RNase H-like nuclease (RuvC/YqgF family)